MRSIDDPSHLADNNRYLRLTTCSAERHELFETFDVAERLRKVRDFYRNQMAMLQVQAKLRQDVQDSANKQQREFLFAPARCRPSAKSWARRAT